MASHRIANFAAASAMPLLVVATFSVIGCGAPAPSPSGGSQNSADAASLDAKGGDQEQRPGNSAPSLASEESIRQGVTDDTVKAATEQVAKGGLPDLALLSTAKPTTSDEIWVDIAAMETLALDLYVSDKPDLAPAARRSRAQYHNRLAAIQGKLYPLLRQAYLEQIQEKLWRANCVAELTGPRKTTFRMTSAAFVDNANIGAVEDVSGWSFATLRVRRADYRWYAGGAGTHYDLGGPADTTVAFHKDGQLVIVK